MLRPEFVRQNAVPLSPDAFCILERDETGAARADLNAAYARLLSTTLPEFVRAMVSLPAAATSQLRRALSASASSSTTKASAASAPSTDFSDPRLPRSCDDLEHFVGHLHSRGLNVRTMGRLRHHLLSIEMSTAAASTAAVTDATTRERARVWRRWLLIEMLARTFKAELRAAFRATMEAQRALCEEPYRACIVRLVNERLGSNAHADEYWATQAIGALNARFENGLAAHDVLSGDELAPSSTFASSSSSSSTTSSDSTPDSEHCVITAGGDTAPLVGGADVAALGLALRERARPWFAHVLLRLAALACFSLDAAFRRQLGVRARRAERADERDGGVGGGAGGGSGGGHHDEFDFDDDDNDDDVDTMFSYEQPLDETHLAAIVPRVKQTNIVAYATGTALFARAHAARKRFRATLNAPPAAAAEYVRLGRLAQSQFEASLRVARADFSTWCE